MDKKEIMIRLPVTTNVTGVVPEGIRLDILTRLFTDLPSNLEKLAAQPPMHKRGKKASARQIQVMLDVSGKIRSYAVTDYYTTNGYPTDYSQRMYAPKDIAKL